MGVEPILDELHRLRAEEMARFNFDFEAYVRALNEQEGLPAQLVQPPPKPAAVATTNRPVTGGR